jgi:formylglycine-generating enzyme required for sulfatase activity
VTQRVYEVIAGNNPSTFRHATRPVETVSWDQAMSFCDKLTQEERRAGRLPNGFIYTLPTESQWETFSADASLDLAATSRNATLASTQDVGASEPNKYGLYDTIGNVWEWCLDTAGSDTTHSLRGGSWLSSQDNFPNAETRNSAGEKYADRFTGFRVVLVPQK